MAYDRDDLPVDMKLARASEASAWRALFRKLGVYSRIALEDRGYKVLPEPDLVPVEAPENE